MKKISTLLLTLCATFSATVAQGWPQNYAGIMLQGFSWDSYVDTRWTNLTSQADELSAYFNLIWVPQSGNCNTQHNVMGYLPVYYYDQNSSFGTEAELRNMITAFKQRGTGIIADVVINHRNNLGVNGSWVDFPSETYNGQTYTMTSKDITGNDDGGTTATWATQNQFTLGANDTGEDWSGCRDVDHSSTNVQNVVKAYTKYLLNDLGYTGFRYDMVKGYAPNYTRDYNQASGVTYSVGEYWDGNPDRVRQWIEGTERNSAAFDFPFRYTVRDAINQNNWALLGNNSLVNSNYYGGQYRRYAVTFVENHDTQYRSATEQLDPIRSDTLAANAYLLAMPGTPCVFLPHWKAYKQEIKGMIDARRLCGITNTSAYMAMRSSANYYSVMTTGSRARLIAIVGKDLTSAEPSSTDYKEVARGYHYRYFVSRNAEAAWADHASGTYAEAFNVRLTALSAASDARLVYTLDGSAPTPNSTAATDGQLIRIAEDCTLKVALVVGNQVVDVATRQYSIKPFEPYTATVYLRNPNWANTYFYAWSNETPVKELLGNWPGTKQTQTTTVTGQDGTWFAHTFNISSSGYSFNIIFNQGSGAKQTIDIGPITQDAYYEIGAEVNGKFTMRDITGEVKASVTDILTDPSATTLRGWYTVDGRRISEPTEPGLYIHDGKKIIIR